jgi:hypothetical protein
MRSITREIATPTGTLSWRPEHGAALVEGGGPELTYGAYFEALEAFLAEDGYAALGRALAAAGHAGGMAGVGEIVVRAEKHGALYHPASVTVRSDRGAAKFCVNVAATPVAAACLEEEAELLVGLRSRFTPEFLPCPYAGGQARGLAFLLEEWFDGFHEFHQDGSGRVRLWDFDAGERVLTAGEAAKLYGEAARILTRYFDAPTGAAIGPWHHAAGDFVGSMAGGEVAARLVTVRGYGASRNFAEAGPMAERLAGLAFFTNMTMRLRLDRVDGVGDLVLADGDVARAAVAGFARGLGERPDLDDGGLSLLDFLGSFSAEELAGAGSQLMDAAGPGERELCARAWPEHAALLVEGLAGV